MNHIIHLGASQLHPFSFSFSLPIAAFPLKLSAWLAFAHEQHVMHMAGLHLLPLRAKKCLFTSAACMQIDG